MITRFEDLLAQAKAKGPRRCVVAAAHDEALLAGLRLARAEKIAHAVLFGNRAAIERLARKVGLPLDADTEVVDIPDDERSIIAAVQTVREGGGFLMKGLVSTATFLRGVLDKKQGLRTGRRLSHVALIDVASYHKLFLMTDGGMNIRPDLRTRIDIVKNALALARAIGIERPKVALLSAVEKVVADIPETVDYEEIVAMANQGEFGSLAIAGPLALDVALSRRAAEVKKVENEVVGDPDILVVPDIATGNILGKSLQYLANAKICGIIMGASRPVVMLSRSDNPQVKLYTIALGTVVA